MMDVGKIDDGMRMTRMPAAARIKTDFLLFKDPRKSALPKVPA
jgi:hypothetical protein